MTSSLPPNIHRVSALPTDSPHFDLSSDRYIAALQRAEKEHFWHRIRNKIIARRLLTLGVAPPAQVLELGCGSGCVTSYLSQIGYRITGVDGHLPLLHQASLRAPNATFLLHDLTRGVEPLSLDNLDAVAFFDVIEHLTDPAEALTTASSLLRTGGLLVGTVPAMKMLWSTVDEQAGHQLRYEKKELEDLLEKIPQTRLLEVAPFNRLLVPMMWLQRKWVVKQGDPAATSERNLTVPPKPINEALYKALQTEDMLSAWLEQLPIPGASLWFALARV